MGILGDLFKPKPGPVKQPSVHGVSSSTDDGPHERWYVPSDGNRGRFVGPDGLPTLHLIPYTDTGGEDVLRLCEDSTGLLVGPSDTRLTHAGILVSRLRGETYHRAACRRGDFTPGARVLLVPEPENPYDPKAVAVYDATGRHLCGYVNKQKARAYLKRVAAGERIEAISIRGTAAGKQCEQVGVLAASPAVLNLLRSPRPTGLPRPAHLRE